MCSRDVTRTFDCFDEARLFLGLLKLRTGRAAIGSRLPALQFSRSVRASRVSDLVNYAKRITGKVIAAVSIDRYN